MIDIINQNKLRKQQMIRKQKMKDSKKEERITYICTLLEYLVGAYIFVQIVTMLVK